MAARTSFPHPARDMAGGDDVPDQVVTHDRTTLAVARTVDEEPTEAWPSLEPLPDKSARTGSLFLLTAIRMARPPRTDPRHRRESPARHREPGVVFLESYLQDTARSADEQRGASLDEPSQVSTSV